MLDVLSSHMVVLVIPYAVDRLQCAVCSVQCSVCNVQCAVYNVQCGVFSVQQACSSAEVCPAGVPSIWDTWGSGTMWDWTHNAQWTTAPHLCSVTGTALHLCSVTRAALHLFSGKRTPLHLYSVYSSTYLLD